MELCKIIIWLITVNEAIYFREAFIETFCSVYTFGIDATEILWCDPLFQILLPVQT